MGVREGQEGRAAEAAEVDPGVLERPTDREEEMAWMDGTAGMGHREVAELSP